MLFKGDRSEKNHYAVNDQLPSPLQITSSQGLEGDPNGRVKYEHLRHANPFTNTIPVGIAVCEKGFIKNSFGMGTSRVRDKNNLATQWIPMGPPGLGGRTRALALDIDDSKEETILAGGVTSGMWKTTDKGKSWYRTSELNETPSVSCILQDTRANKRNIWYYGTGELFSINDLENDNGVIRGSGIYKSFDKGESWSLLTTTRSGLVTNYDNSFDYVWNLAQDTSNHAEDELYAATAGGIYRSIDGGTNWNRVLGDGNTSGRYTDVVVSTQGVVYATISNTTGNSNFTSGIYRSENGITWQSTTPISWPRIFNRTVLALCPSNENKLYLISDLSSLSEKKHLLMQYQHSGIWKDLSENLPDYTYSLGDYDSQISFNMIIRVKPNDENVVFLGGTNLYRSDDGFSTPVNTHWIGGYNPRKNDQSKYPNQHPDQHAIVFQKDHNKMIVAHDGGISFTNDNTKSYVEWVLLNSNYVTTQFYTIAMNPQGSNLQMIGGMQDNGTYGTNDATPDREWESLLAGDGAYCAISNNGLRRYVSSQYGRIYRLDYDTRGKYTGFTRIDPSAPLPYLFINPFVLDPYNSNVMYLAGGTHLWRNHNLAAIASNSDATTLAFWKRIESTATNGIITAIAVSTEPRDIVFFGTTRGRLYRMDDSLSDNPRVTDVTGANFPKYFGNPVGYISSISINPFNASDVLITFSNYEIQSVFHSTDAGLSWNDVAGNLEENTDGTGAGPAVYTSATLELQNASYYFVGTSSGLFGTTQLNGVNTIWQQLGSSTIGYAIIYMLSARQSDGKLVAASHGNGLFVASYSNVVPPVLEPLSVSLSQNYPNPFSRLTGTTFSLSLDETQFVSLAILDVNGREVTQLLNKELDAGHYSIAWNDINATQGIYYARMRTRFKSFTIRMVLQ